MVDWERVQELRSKGWDWSDVARDPKVDFHPDASAGSPGRALRALYQRTGRRSLQAAASAPTKKVRKDEAERKWNLMRVGYLLVPTVGVWFALAFAAPSPIGLVVPAIPYLALGLAAAAFILIYALWRRTEGRRWTPVYRTTVIGGVVLGLIVSGAIGLSGSLIFGCPYLPPSSSLTGQGNGWEYGSIAAWQTDGKPVIFEYAATWCPYCSASSWAIYKALAEYGTVTNVQPGHSASNDVYSGTVEVVISSLQLGSKNGNGPAVDLQAAEDTSGVDGTLPPTGSCYQQAYVSAYASGIPFLVVNGQYVHLGTMVNPANLTAWDLAHNASTGFNTVLNSVNSESGKPWLSIENPAWRLMAIIAKCLGYSASTVGTLATDYGWSSATKAGVIAKMSA
jgi:Domain of unknown function (DUF929)